MSLAAPPPLPRLLRKTDAASDVGHTLRRARERLASSEGLPPGIERDLLDRHARMLPFLLLLQATLLAMVGLAAWESSGPPGVWLASGAASMLAPLAAAWFYARRNRLDVAIGRWPRLFQLAQLTMALPWVLWTLTLDCGGCAPALGEGIRFLSILSWLLGTAFLASNLAFALPIAALPLALPVIAGLLASPSGSARIADLSFALLVPAFALVAYRSRRATIEHLRHTGQREQLMAEVEIARVHFEEAKARAEEASLAKSRFLATMSHELRTPLNAILGFSEVIMKEILGPVGNPTYKDYVGDIHNSGQHLLDLINEILDLSRIEAGRYTLNEEAVDLVSVAEASIAFLQLKADAKNIALVGEFEADLPQLWGDPRSLRQVTLNLLSNAVKFTPANGRILVRVGWTAGGGQYISVRDTGPGIPAHEIPVVLSSFGQGAAAIKSAEQGTGLGLPIVRALVELHNGQFELHSALGKGTEAIAILPHSRVLEVMPAIADFD